MTKIREEIEHMSKIFLDLTEWKIKLKIIELVKD